MKRGLDMPDRIDLNGLRIKLPGDPKIYLMDLGKRRWIPNPNVYNSLFRNWVGIIEDIDIVEITTGSQIPVTAILFRAYDSPKVFLLDGNPPNQVKRWITSPAVMDRYNFDWGRIHVWNVPLSALVYPDGPNIRDRKSVV
jgi:hypothetical protein